MKDPYYQKILHGLERLDNPAAFEECACDLLRDAYPSLTWVHGGSDAGMDGAIADGKGEAYPFVVTTRRDVTRNLRDSLGSYVRHGKERRRAVFATSRKVTPKKRRKLEAIARDEHGFTLENIYDQHDFAARLYRDSRWVGELLGITLEPPALSAVPRTRRPFPDVELVGREADLQWLHETQGHRLVVGQPGSGKTALFLQLVWEGKALFLASDDEARIAAAYRDSRPSLILVDDAHLDPDKLTRLLQIRAELGADFEIVASTWPGTENDVADALGGIGSSSIRRLELLTQSEILKVLRGIGISEADDDPYLGLLVEQSANKPGLAVTLGSLWLRGEGIDVLTGRALRRSLIPALKRVVEHDPTRLLACFALGGDCGMSLETVGKFLEIPLEEAHRRASLASQGGVLSVHRDNLLSVQPEAFRYALLAEVFFTPPSLPYLPLLEGAPDRGRAIETLAIAASRGVEVSRQELQKLVLEGSPRKAWQAFALLGENEGRWVLENYSGNIATVVPQLLQTAPRPTIQRLLHEAENAEARPHWGLPHPLRMLKDWVQEIPDPPFHPDQLDEIFRRRGMQVSEAKRYLRQDGDRTAGLWGCFLALSPRLKTDRMTVTGDAVRTWRDTLPISTLPKVLQLWSEILEDLSDLTPESWPELENALQDWGRPGGYLGPQLDEEDLDRYRDVAKRIVSDLADRAQGRPGLSLALKEWAARINLPLEIPQDKDFAVLFPLTDDFTPENWTEQEKAKAQAARELATRWASRSPQEVSRQLIWYEAEARGFRHPNSNTCWAFAQALANTVEAPGRWLKTFLQERLPDRWLSPLLQRVVQQRHSDWKQDLVQCLESDDYSRLAQDLVIRSEGIPKKLIDTTLEQIPAELVETACLQSRVPLKTLRSLLQHRREGLALAASVGEWLAEPRGKVRPQIQTDWQSVVVRLGSVRRLRESVPNARHAFKRILGADSDLAMTWLIARIEEDADEEVVRRDGIYAAAIQPLPQDRREALLCMLAFSGFSARLIPLLVGDSEQLYKYLLGQDRLRPYHLTPLGGRPPDATWIALARLALESGHEPQAIAKVAFRNSGARRGFGIEHWRKWEKPFRELSETASGGLKEVAQNGLEMARAELSRSEDWKRQFELTGKLYA